MPLYFRENQTVPHSHQLRTIIHLGTNKATVEEEIKKILAKIFLINTSNGNFIKKINLMGF